MRRKSKLRLSKCMITVILILLLTVTHSAGESSSSENYSSAQSYNATSSAKVTETNKVEEETPPHFKNIYKLVDTLYKRPGSVLRLQCVAEGRPMPNITWTRNDLKIERSLGKVTYKKWSIQLDDVILDDSGSYKCLVCNILGCIEHTTEVFITDRLKLKPYISGNYLQNRTVFINDNTELECRVESALEPYIYWVKYSQDDVPIGKLQMMIYNENYKISENFVILKSDWDTPNILKLTNVSHQYEGWYTCVAINAWGKSIASAYLMVLDKPTPTDVTAYSGWFFKVAIVVVVLILVGAIYIIMFFLRNHKYREHEQQHFETVYQWTKKVIISVSSSEDNSGILQIPIVRIEKQCIPLTTSTNRSATIAYSEYDFPIDTNWEIPRSKLSLGSVLGEGCFGRVVMGRASGLHGTATTEVAVKMVKDDYIDSDVASLVREMELMKIIGKHINIINLLGCCSQNGPLWVIVEFARYGNLKDFLQANRTLDMANKIHLTEKHLSSFALQIAQGMEYLASRQCIHRDLAARNVLVSDDYIMKIADFGLARDIQDKDYYRKNTCGRLPIKWMAPESMQDRFYNSQSDVWSYGVLLWEIMTYGEQPYAHIMSADELFSFLISGKRMAIPRGCSRKIYLLMQKCWHIDAHARPTFTEIVDILNDIIQLTSITFNTKYVNLPNPEINISLSSNEEESEVDSYTPMYGYAK